jgi:hypothetical protein
LDYTDWPFEAQAFFSALEECLDQRNPQDFHPQQSSFFVSSHSSWPSLMLLAPTEAKSVLRKKQTHLQQAFQLADIWIIRLIICKFKSYV